MEPSALASAAPSWRPTEHSALPSPRRVLPLTMRDGAEIVVRQHGDPDGPRVVVSHGNGLATDLYLPFWRHFLGDFEVIAFDFRSHGWNRPADRERHRFPSFVWDLETVWQAVQDALGRKPMLGVFHSMSALTAIYHALRAGPRWDALVLFEPPVAPPSGHRFESDFLAGVETMGRRSRRRQERFAGYADFTRTVRSTPLFAGFVDEAAELYAPATFAPEPGHGVRLRCPREHEAQVYVSNTDTTFWMAMGGFPGALKVLGGDPTRPDAGLPSQLCQVLFPEVDVDYDYVPGTSHFLQLEQPQRCAALTLEHFERGGFI